MTKTLSYVLLVLAALVLTVAFARQIGRATTDVMNRATKALEVK